MAHDIDIEAGVIPVLDKRAEDALIRRVARLQSKISSGVSSKASEELAALTRDYTASMVATGRAATSTSARIMLEKKANVTNAFAKAATRQGSDEGKIALREGRVIPFASFSERQMSRWNSDLFKTSTAYNEMISSYAKFKVSPSEERKNELLKAVLSVNTQLSNISKDRKAEIKTFGKIEKGTQAIQKEATSWKSVTRPSATANAVGAASFFKSGLSGLLRILGISSIIGGIKKWVDLGVSGTKEGSQDLLEQAMYGGTRNISIGRSRAKMYGLDESVTAAPERYALDFRTRMMWGEVSDQEWIALSRMGTLGRKIISGEAAQNPKAFQQDIEQYIEQNRGNEAEVRWALTKLGWSPQLMKYGAIKYSEEDKNRLEETYAQVSKDEKDAAVLVWKTADEFAKFMAELKNASAKSLSVLTDSDEARRRLGQSWGRMGYSDIERGVVKKAAEDLVERRLNPKWKDTHPTISDILHSTGEDFRRGNVGIMRPSALDYAHPEITNYNNFYINGGDSKEVTNTVQDALYPAKASTIIDNTTRMPE